MPGISRNSRCPEEVRRFGFTLVEMLVVIAIIGVLASLTLPALNMALSSSRRAACQNNLRQLGVALLDQAGRNSGRLCSGAFDWQRDGCVTEVGWVADLVNDGANVGEMTCPGNPAQVSSTYNQLFSLNAVSLIGCVDVLGSPPKSLPDGSVVLNPCREIAILSPGSETRRQVIEQRILQKHYNTNYAASWFLVRGGPALDSSGNLRQLKAGCGVSIRSRNSTLGPLVLDAVAASKVSASVVPLLGDASMAGSLLQSVGPFVAGEPVAESFTTGPVLKTTLKAPVFPNGTNRDGPSGWWKTWARDTLQDYRGFGAIHQSTANILFADGSVRAVTDGNRDGLLNNGFLPITGTGFADSTVEFTSDEIFSLYDLRSSLR